ncbi:MAG TPA: bifunctional serine/threonine-protein kinase/universal stress protein [Anaeromyxobacter sp.]|nr:bifunctional serine/threonine-protein kinase/universal stress protein [Anaeromyxobacter sp.]
MRGAVRSGEVIDGWRVEERVHSGGMAVIYAVSGGDGRVPLVMKVPRLGHGEGTASVISYEVEQTVLGALTGPHVPRLVATGDIGDPYLVMERIEGTPLSELTGKGPLDAGEVARIGAALATAVHAIHRQEVIHLDLKPSNVILRSNGEAVLVDFGLAHHAHHPDLLAEESQEPAGSPPYVSPEQLLGVRWDPRSDVFAIGAILYELAVGRLPFGAPTSRGGLRKRLYRDPIPPRAIVPAIPEWLQEVILRCLEPSAADRYASAAQLAFALAHADQVEVTDRGRRLERAGAATVLRRWIRAAGFEPAPIPNPTAHLAGASIVLVAIATSRASDGSEPSFDALREGVKHLVAGEAHARLACVTVVKRAPELGGSDEETAAQRRLQHTVLLRDWAEPLRLPAGRVSLHVLESNDPAEAILQYARVNHVDHIVIGAPPRAVPNIALPSTVSMRVAIDATCTVTLVRPRAPRA